MFNPLNNLLAQAGNALSRWGGNYDNNQSTQLIDELNPKFKDFANLSNDEKNAILNSIFEKNVGPESGDTVRFGYSQNNYSSMVYGGIQTNKAVRLDGYRRMAQFPEIGNAIEEICDNSVNYDENGELCQLDVDKEKIKEIKFSTVEKEYEKYISLFKLDHNYYDYMRLLVGEGELAWENIIDTEHKDQGIIGINYLPTESYEFLLDEKCKKTGITVMLGKDTNVQEGTYNGVNSGGVQTQSLAAYYDQKQQAENNKEQIPGKEKIELAQKKGVPMLWDQITYIDSGIYNPNRLIVYPVLEKARKAYRQLSLIEDAIIIFRLARAPVRLAFNIDCGKMPPSKGMQEVQKLMKRHQTKRFYNSETGGVSNDYDPTSMLESYWFYKSEGSTGTTVDKIDQGVNWTELPDLEYFQKKLYNSLKIPWESRIKDPKVKVQNADVDISAEEFRFTKFIMRLVDRFSIGLTKGFVTHLKLTGVWKQYELTEDDVRIKFNYPIIHELYMQQRLIELKFKNYDIVTKEHPEIARTLAMKKYLDYTDADIEENYKALNTESERFGASEFKREKIKSQGNPNLTAT